MNEWMNLLSQSEGLAGLDALTVLLIMAVSFTLGIFIGFVYMWTHEAISYSRTFVAALAVLPLIVALMMAAMAGSIVVAFGLLAVLGVIRFRNVLKDTRDTSFILWVIMVGLSVGTLRYTIAVLGSLGIAAAFLLMRSISFGTRNRYDAVLSLRLTGDTVARGQTLRQLLTRHASSTFLASQRRVTNEGMDVSYRLLLRNPARSDELQAELAQTEGFENVAVYMHDDEAEI